MKHAIRHIHFVGIGGAGMSGIAEVLLNQGYRISGSDLAESSATRRLVAMGAEVFSGHDARHIEGADAIVVFCTGQQGHLLNPNLEAFDALMKKGTGVVMIHWATEAKMGPPAKKFLEWMGGFCDPDWSVNPHWTPKFEDFPDHPVAKGLKPFAVNDEWYYHMRFVGDMKGVIPILTAVPPAETLTRPDGPRSGNPAVRKA